MLCIEDFRFGVINISGKRYSSDVKIIGNRVISPWWRSQGHKVFLEDVEDIVEDIDVLILGQGDPGMMKSDPSLKIYLKNKGIKLIEIPTKEAIIEFNSHVKKQIKVGAGFHLTC